MLKSGKFAVTAKLGIRQGIVLVVLSLMIGGSFNALRPSKFPWVGSWSPSSVTADLLEELQEISLEEACSLRQKNEAIFLDARDPGSFDEGHFPGALNIPFGEVEGWVESVRDMANTGMKIISYCDGRDCLLGAELARALQKKGVPSVKVLVNGWSRWRTAGCPIEKEEG